MQAGDVETGLAQAAREVGELLKTHFPIASHHRNPNELPDAVVLL